MISNYFQNRQLFKVYSLLVVSVKHIQLNVNTTALFLQESKQYGHSMTAYYLIKILFSISAGCFQENIASTLIQFSSFNALWLIFIELGLKLKRFGRKLECMFDLELLELICLFDLNAQDQLSCNPICYLVFCGLLSYDLIFQETVVTIVLP